MKIFYLMFVTLTLVSMSCWAAIGRDAEDADNQQPAGPVELLPPEQLMVDGMVRAASEGFQPLRNYLHAHNIPIDFRDEFGATALHRAVRRSRLHAVRTLLEEGMDANIRDYFFHQTPLFFARGEEMIGLLLDHGARIDIQGFDGRTALTGAVEVGDVNTVRILLAHGAGNIQQALNNAYRLQPMMTDRPAYSEIIRLLQEERNRRGWLPWLGRMMATIGRLIIPSGSEGNPSMSIPRSTAAEEAAERQASSSTPQTATVIHSVKGKIKENGKGKEKAE